MSVTDKSYSYLLNPSTIVPNQYVALLDDKVAVGVTNNVLGKASDHAIGKVIKIENGCAHVQYGSEQNIGIYDVLSLGSVFATLKNGAINQTGCLGASTANASKRIVGSVVDWSNFGKGDQVKISIKKPRSTGTTKPDTSYSVTDLIFHIASNTTTQAGIMQDKMSGGGSSQQKRYTVRRKKFTNLFTRFIKRV